MWLSHIWDKEKNRVHKTEKNDNSQSVTAINIYCQDCGVASSKVDWCHWDSKDTDGVCIL